MSLWRLAVTMYLSKAHRRGLLNGGHLPDQFQSVIHHQAERRWNIYVSRAMSKRHFLGYAGRYIRRLPISQRRILKVSEMEVVYQSKDTRNKAIQETHSTPAEFVALIAEHVPDRYRHSMRYFGLLAPQLKRVTSGALFHCLGQHQRPRPPRLGWRQSLLRDFQVDPLRDNRGNTMQWVRRLKPSIRETLNR